MENILFWLIINETCWQNCLFYAKHYFPWHSARTSRSLHGTCRFAHSFHTIPYTITMILASSPNRRSARDTRQIAHYTELKWNSDNIEVVKNVAYTTRHDMSSWYLIAWVFRGIHSHCIPSAINSKWQGQRGKLADIRSSINMDNSFPTVVYTQNW